MQLRTSSLSVVAVVSALAQACMGAAQAPAPAQPPHGVYIARAYALQGLTADGSRAERGVVAADTRVLPLGTKIRVSGAGTYSGEYVVRDTGRLVHGNRLDVFVPTTSEARRFGRRMVKVEVIGSIKARAGSAAAGSSAPPVVR